MHSGDEIIPERFIERIPERSFGKKISEEPMIVFLAEHAKINSEKLLRELPA